MSEATASEDDTWSQVLFRATRAKLLAGQGRHDEAADLGDAAVAIAERTDLLDLRGDVLLDLAVVLSSAGAQDEANASVRRALALYELKGNLVSAERARTLLGEALAKT
jgi:tetratricopeptide (TPR) repeat protein